MDWEWIARNRRLFGGLLADHIYLAMTPVCLGLLVSLALGVACVSWPRLYPPVLAATSFLYALPSIVLIIILIDYFGLTWTSVIIPLTIYSVSVLIRNVVEGLRAVPDAVRLAATAMGYTRVSRLIRIDLPLAVPTIMAGLRVTAVSNISLVSIASLIGLGGLGQLFTNGFQLAFPTEIIVGIVLTVLLAVAADTALVLLQRLLTPWVRRGVEPRRRARMTTGAAS
jgi:osmoprotectant transport system permease protein